MMYKEAFNRLPERFRKTNTEKLYYVLYNDAEDLKETFETIRESRNIDKAEGHTLDLIGANVGQFRTDEDDEFYRLLIKTRIIANLSIGDIPTINKVMSALVKDVYLGLSETWTDDYRLKEPAAIELNLAGWNNKVSMDIINRIKSAGVRVYFSANYFSNLYLATNCSVGESITILPPKLEDLVTEKTLYIATKLFTTHEVITIKKE